MRFWWQPRIQNGREAVRPRVASAVAAARQAGTTTLAGLGSARVDYGLMRQFEAMDRAAQTQRTPPVSQLPERSARHIVNRDLVWATARAARNAGRTPEEVFAEALHNWLLEQDTLPAPRPATLEVRRQQTWSEIDRVLHGLRTA